MRRGLCGIYRNQKKWLTVSSYQHSETTCIKLFHLPLATTLQSLNESIRGVGGRNLELEPGCLLHFKNEIDSEEFCSLLSKKLGLKVIAYVSILVNEMSTVPILFHVDALNPRQRSRRSPGRARVEIDSRPIQSACSLPLS
jgi:hypothetical protein